MLFAALASGLSVLLIQLYSVGYMRGNKREKNQTRFFACFALRPSATMGIAFAGKPFTLFLFIANCLTLSTYPLVAHKGDPATVASSEGIYLGVTT